MLKNKLGITALSLAVSLAIASAIAVPTAKWIVTANQKSNQIEDNLYQLTVVEDRLLYLKGLPSDEIKTKCKNNTTISDNLKNRYSLTEQYFSSKNASNDVEYKVKMTLVDRVTNKKYITEKVILSAQNEPLSQIKYINNLSYPNHKLSVRYDTSTKKIKWYIDGEELHKEDKNRFEEGNGYAIFDNGFIIQWGRTTSNTIFFPKTFPHKCFNLIPTVSVAGTPSYVYDFNNSSASIETYGSITNWVALGY